MDRTGLNVFPKRRQLLKLGLFSVWTMACVRWRKLAKTCSLEFYIAGVRYQKGDAKPQKNDIVIVHTERHNQEICYTLCTEDGNRLGFIPQNLIPQITNATNIQVRLQEAYPHRVPWKRYRVSLTYRNRTA